MLTIVLKNILTNILSYIFAVFSKFQIFLYKQKNIIITHNQTMGFGDSMVYMFLNYRKIKKKKIHIFNYIKFTKNISDFFFGAKSSLILKPSVPHKLYYQYMSRYANQFFNDPNFYYFKYDIHEWYKNKNIKFSFNRLVRLKLKKYKFDRSLLPKKYISLNLKYFNDQKDNLSESVRRQVINPEKFIDVFKFLDKKKISVVITNSKNEKFYQITKKILKNNNLKNIFFFNELIDNPNFVDQCFLAINSKGFLGSESGPQILYLFLNKKAICIDGLLDRAGYSALYNILIQKFSYRFLLKKIKINNKIYNLDLEVIKKTLAENNNYSVIGCNSKEIIDEIIDFIEL